MVLMCMSVLEALSHYREEGFPDRQQLQEYLPRLYLGLRMNGRMPFIHFTLKSQQVLWSSDGPGF